MVQLLIDYGADINVEHEGMSALSISIEKRLVPMSKILVKQIALLQGQNLFVSKVNLDVLKAHGELTGFQLMCDSEIESLKKNPFVDTSYFYFDIFKIRDNSILAALAINENIVKVVKSDDLKEKFPNYGEMLVERFDRAIFKNKDFELIKRFINYLAVRNHDILPELPFTFVSKLFTYLEDKDVAVLRKL